MQTGTVEQTSLTRIRQIHADLCGLLLSAAERKWEIGRLLSEVRESEAARNDWQLWCQINLPFSLSWERECREFHRRYPGGPPTDFERLRLKEAAETKTAIDGNVTFAPALPSYARADNAASMVFTKWKNAGCPQPDQMLRSIDATLQLLQRQRDEVRGLLLQNQVA